MSEYQFLKIAIQHRVATVTIERPPVNALSIPLLEELSKLLDELTENQEVKALVITGAGQQVFIAGADINIFAEIGEMGDATKMKEQADHFINLGQATYLKLDRMAIPTIVAINGACLGGGMELALACDIRIAADNARMGQPEINLGIIPGWGGTQRLPRLIGESRALELILTGDTIPAPQALQIGLVNKVVPAAQLMREAQGLARKIAEKSRLAVAASLAAVAQASELSIEEGLAFERAKFEYMTTSEDMREGVGAFLQKRKPSFKDR